MHLPSLLLAGLVACCPLLSGVDPAPPDDDSARATAVAPDRSGAAPMGTAEARHLLARAGFGGTLAEIERFAGLTRPEAVARLLGGLRTETLLPEPGFLLTPRSERTLGRGATREERQAFQRTRRQQIGQLKAWWMAEMTLTDSPLTERLVLFWHNHFVSESRKVSDPEFVWRQNALLREHAAGSFRTMLSSITLDPAMVIYLDTQQNNRAKPNENFARELLELFTLGEGHYTEADIKEAARAFTGWKVDRRSGAVRLVARQHDAGEKTFFGRTGRFEFQDILDIVLERPRVAEFIVEELWREFISPELDPAEVTRLAAIFRGADYQLRPLYEALLLSPAFWAETNRGALIRSPVDLVVGTARVLRLDDVPPQSLHRAAVGMGQNVFDPPNVKGWPGGERWITSSSLLTRHQFLERATTGLQVGPRGRSRDTVRDTGRGTDRAPRDEPAMEPGMEPGREPGSEPGMDETGDDPPRRGVRRRATPRPIPPAMAMLRDSWTALGTDDAERAEALAEHLCALSPVSERAAGERPLATLRRLLLDPTYQLK